MLPSSPDRSWSAVPRRLPLGPCAAALLLACASADRVAAPADVRRADLAAAALPAVRISEFHYDNAGTDAGEAIEVSFPVGTDLSGYRVVRFNGNTASAAVAYTTPGPASGSSETLSGLTPAACSNGTRAVVVVRYAVDGLQNGERDGFALVNGSAVVELLSYEGTFTVSSGSSVAAGQMSVDVGVSETTNTPVGSSLARTGAGTWNAAAPNTFGVCNDGDDGSTPSPVGPLATVTVTPAAASVDVGASVTLTAVAEDAEGDDITDGTVTWSDGGSPNVTVTPSTDGRTASVRGDAAGGPVNVVATLTRDGVTRADTAAVTVATPRPPGTTRRVAFSGFNSAPLPPGFEDQIFARAFSGASNADSLPGVTFTWRALTPALATIDANGVVRGASDGRAQFEARSSDGFPDTAFVDVRTPVDPTTAVYGNHLEFGAPADATPADDYVVTYPEFVASYNAERGQPNWVAYNLEATHRGPAERCDCFSPDTALPAAFRRVSTSDYTGSGFTRGHMVMSEDRTTGPNPPQTSVDNARTFLFTNIVPQLAANNSGPWLELETYLGGLATGGTREVYIYAGGARYQGTLKNEGRVAVPSRTWKVAVVLERDRGLGDARTASDVVDVIAIDMPNLPADSLALRGRPWTDFRVSVDSVERLTGYDFLAALPDGLEAQLEAAVPGARPVGIDVQPERISLASTSAVTVVLYSGAAFDAVAAAAPGDLRLVVDGAAAVAPITRGTTVNASSRDVDGDGRLDRVVSFSTSALRAAGLRAGSALTLVPAGASPAFRGADATPPVVAP